MYKIKRIGNIIRPFLIISFIFLAIIQGNIYGNSNYEYYRNLTTSYEAGSDPYLDTLEVGQVSMGGLAVSGDYVFYCDNDGLHVADISDPYNIEIVFQNTIAGADSCTQMFVYGDRLYGQFMGPTTYVYDISNPTSPTLIGQNSSHDSIYPVSETLIVSGDTVIDVTDPSNWIETDTLWPEIQPDTSCHESNVLYSSDTGQKLHSLDISNKYNVQDNDTYTASSMAHSIAVSGNYVYIGEENGLRIINATDINDLSQVAFLDDFEECSHLRITSDCLYATFHSAAGLYTGKRHLICFDISDPASVTNVTILAHDDMYINDDMEISGDILVLCSWSGLQTLKIVSDTADKDTDGDGVIDLAELWLYYSSPTSTDSDSDGLPDNWEIANNLYAWLDDSNLDGDEDNLSNLKEYQADTDPWINDTDDDGMLDGYEVRYSLNPKLNDAAGDPDSDDLTNLEEFTAGTDPNRADTDGDGFTDKEEIDAGTNPTFILNYPGSTIHQIIISIIALVVIGVLLLMRSRGVFWSKADINVFISHAKEDREQYRIHEIVKTVEKQKKFSKIDPHQQKGWSLDDCHMFLFIATDKSVNSDQSEYQIRKARKNDLFIIPIKSKDLDWSVLADLNLHRELGFELDKNDLSPTQEEINDYLVKFKKDIDKLQIVLRKNSLANMAVLERSLDISDKHIKKLSKILSETGKIQGVWSKNDKMFLGKKELKKRYDLIKNRLEEADTRELMIRIGVNEESIDKALEILGLSSKKKGGRK